MPASRKYNSERVPVGGRIRVHCTDPHEGSDRDWHGHLGVVTRSEPSWVEVMMDRPKQNRPNPVILCWHNVVPVK